MIIVSRRRIQRSWLVAAFVGTSRSAAWSSIARERHDNHRRRLGPCCGRLYASSSSSSQQESWLIVGDGDLSYAAWLAPQLDRHHVALTASVWEDCPTHRQVYRNSARHTQTIRGAGHDVTFGVDATRLADTLLIDHNNNKNNDTTQKLDRIIFNFPHWRGKANNRYNRRLLDEFFGSAAHVLRRPRGQIHMALLRGQSGVDADSLPAWRQSWMAQDYANQHGLLLQDVQPFEVAYNLSSHRGVDRAFSPGQDPRCHVFGWEASPPALQLACRHELRLRLDPQRLGAAASDGCPYTMDELARTHVIPDLVHACVPPGIHVELPLRDVVNRKQSAVPVLIFLIVYAGATEPLSRAKADAIRARVEDHVGQVTGLEIAKAGRRVSKPFPYALLESIQQEYIVSNQTAVEPLP